jgi:hypothetical protein
VVVGALTLTAEDLDRLAAELAPLVAARLDRHEEWFTPKQYVEAGYAPSEDAVRQRVRRRSIKFKREGNRLLVAGPSNEG